YVTDATAPPAIDGLFVPMPATRLVDATSATDRLAGGYRRDLAVASAGAFPASGAAAVLARVRAVAPADTGGVAVYPGGTPAPQAPSVYASTPGQGTGALLLLRLGTQGTLSARADMAVGLDVD